MIESWIANESNFLKHYKFKHHLDCLGKGGLSRINSKLRGSTSTLLVLVVNIYVISILCSLTSVYMFSESYELSPNFAHYTSLSIIDVIRIVIDISAFPIFCLLKLFTIYLQWQLDGCSLSSLFELKQGYSRCFAF